MFFVNRMNGVGNASIGTGPTPEGSPDYSQFHDLADAFDRLDDAGGITIAKSEEDPQELVLYVFEHDDPNVSATLDYICGVLGVESGKSSYTIRLGVRPEADDDIVINTRPLVGAMFFLGHGAEIPVTLLDDGRVHVAVDSDGARVDWSSVTSDLMSIRSASARPKDAFVAARYRGYWYYIDASDIDSRETLAMLNTVMVLKAGGKPGVGPTLTLPVD